MFERAIRATRRAQHRRFLLALVALAGLLVCVKLVRLAEAQAQELIVASGFADKTLAPGEPVEIRFNRPLQSSEGRLAVFIGQTDMTALFISSETGLAYAPGAMPLREGETEIIVYLVSSTDQWKEVARFPLRISATATQPQDGGNQPAGDNQPVVAQQTNGARRWGFDKATFTPSLTIGFKAQMAESHFPATNIQGRSRYADFTLQGSLRSELARGLFNSQTQFDLVGSSYQNEALRFALEGRDAPQIDLASYLMQFQMGKAKMQVGQIAVGAFRHLISSYASRGVSLTMPFNSRSDFSIAAINGTNIVGWSNFLGLDRRRHQIVTGTIGFEFDRQRPGGIRLEAGLLYGSLLPISNFNQGSVTDAERSRGAGFRFVASDRSQRFRLDSGFARSNFDNPSDASLNQGFDVVAARQTSRNARYLDASFDILRDVSLTETKKANLTLTYRHETVDPLFRSVAALTQADRLQNQIEITASVADITASVAYNRFHDNLDDIPSILKTLSRRSGFIIGAPLVSLFGDPSKPSALYPRVSYNFERVHQFGAGLPVNSGFTSASQIPDQVSTNQSFLSEWQAQKWRLGYRFNRSFQDNRQTGREMADLTNLVNAISFGVNPASAIDIGFELSVERARNREQNRIDHTNRAGANINWRMTRASTLAATLSTIFAGDVADTSDSRNAEFDLQWSYRFAADKGAYRKVQGQFFVRYANRYARSLDNLFGFSNLTRLQTFNIGLSFTFF